jgi:hypothetical protein
MDDKIVALTPGEDGQVVEITDANEVAVLRDLIDKRRALGIEISRRLIDKHGLISASDTDTVITAY